MSVDWNYFDKFDKYCDLYMPSMGEGDTLASQLVTATAKLIYKWYNDGDVFDNTGSLDGWANDLSSYANWIYKYFPKCRRILYSVCGCCCGGDYEELLQDLADRVFDSNRLEELNSHPKEGSIYDCDGPFKFIEYCDDDDDDYYW